MNSPEMDMNAGEITSRADASTAVVSEGGLTMQRLAVEVWRHSHSVKFGQSEQWDDGLFLAPWANTKTKAKGPGPWSEWSKYREGWYWFLVDGEATDHAKLSRPSTLPKNGCDIGVVAQENLRVFGKNLLCAVEVSGRAVVYNGHEKHVKNRVRAHFSLQNDRTGALGVRHFPLNEARWELRVFGQPCLADVSPGLRDTIATLMTTKSGRSAIESAWRAVYGWPLLCKQ